MIVKHAQHTTKIFHFTNCTTNSTNSGDFTRDRYGQTNEEIISMYFLFSDWKAAQLMFQQKEEKNDIEKRVEWKMIVHCHSLHKATTRRKKGEYSKTKRWQESSAKFALIVHYLTHTEKYFYRQYASVRRERGALVTQLEVGSHVWIH